MTNREALSHLLEAASHDPANGKLRYQLAAELADQGDYDKAVLEFVAATTLDPTLHVARFQLALLQLTLNRVDQSLSTLTALRQLDLAPGLRSFSDGLDALIRDDLEGAAQRLRHGIELNRENEPLNRDMQLLIERIEAAQTQDMERGTKADTEPRDVRTDFSLYGMTKH